MTRITVIVYALTWGIVFTRHALAFRHQDGWRLGLTAKMRVPLIWAVAGLFYGIAGLWTALWCIPSVELSYTVSRVGIITVTLPLAVMSHTFYRAVRRGDYDGTRR